MRTLRLTLGLKLLLGSVLTLGVLAALVVFPLDRVPFSSGRITSLKIFDRHGELLREVLSSQEGRGRWCTLKEISPHLINAVIATEDARFYHHPGVDPLALCRAAWQNMRAGRIISGGSTISMQVIRNVFHPKRTFIEKGREAWYALRLERMMSKEEILLQYVNRVPFGNQTFGIDAAARMYFGKPPAQLSLAEAAFLAAIPNSPSVYDPYKRFARIRKRQLHILDRMKEGGYITREDCERAGQEPLVLIPRSAQFKAPHFTTMILHQLTPEEKESTAEIYTSLDYRVQKSVELLLRGHLARLKKHAIGNGAVVVIDNRTHELVALVGSRDFFDTAASGQVNGALALRQPGSTLKPFTYGIALDQGMTAATLLADIPRLNGNDDTDFLPENYDKKFHGPVRMRTALACSYNVPAVRTLERFGEEMLLQKLHAAGFESLTQPSAFYGVGLTLGNGEVTLLELANAYSALANRGTFHSLQLIDSVKGSLTRTRRGATRTLFPPQVAYLLTDILSDAQARAPAFGVHSSLSLPFPCAAKTGTSKDYKDNWTVGYTPVYTVAVWVGNFDAKPMKLVSGITGAAPLFRDIMLLLHQSYPPVPFTVPEGLTTARICPRSGMLVRKDCPGEMREMFIAGTEMRNVCTIHRKLRIDGRNGLLAARSTPREYVEERVFEIFPPLFAAWAEKEGIPKPPTDVSRDLGGNVPLAISSPMSGDVFRLDPILRSDYQTIAIQSLVNAGVHRVSLWMNGREIAALQPPFRFRLPLASLPKGRHTLVVKGMQGTTPVESRPVTVAVE